MFPKSNYVISGLAILAATIGALPVANGLGAATKEIPQVHVNRAAKGDRFVQPRTTARKTPVQIEIQREPLATRSPITPSKPSGKERIMDGCEPMFSPVTVPSMAHLAGRCVG